MIARVDGHDALLVVAVFVGWIVLGVLFEELFERRARRRARRLAHPSARARNDPSRRAAAPFDASPPDPRG